MKTAIWGHLPADARREGSPQEIVARCKRSGVDVYLPYVYPRADVEFSYGPACGAGIFQDEATDLLSPLAAAAKSEGVEIEPWILPFEGNLLVGETAEEMALRTYLPLDYDPAAPEPVGGRKAGKRLCPTWAENRARGIRVLNAYIECCGSDLAGVNLDGIRYGDTATCWDHPCHCAACRRKYSELFGEETLTSEALQVPGVRYEFIRFRNECITELVSEMREIAHRAGLRITISARAGVFTTAIPEGQDWPRWTRDGLIDAIYVMNYSTDRETHLACLREHAAVSARRAPGILHFEGLGKKSSLGQMDSESLGAFAGDAIREGVDGVCVFHYNGMTDADFEVLRKLKE
jgi:hypothetical protein